MANYQNTINLHDKPVINYEEVFGVADYEYKIRL